jgi:TPR repeat protein
VPQARLRPALILVLAALAGAAGAAPRDLPARVRELTPKAEAGDPQAQDELGDLYFWGHGVELDYDAAFEWHRRAFQQQLLAAKRGDAEAQWQLGDWFEHGHFVALDPREAARWYRAAAARDEPFAQLSLARLYAAGLGVPHDDALARQWGAKGEKGALTSAVAGRGYHAAMVGYAYYWGQGVSQDRGLAARWFERAAAAPDAPRFAFEMLGILHAAGDGVPKDVDKARREFEQAADRGLSSSEYLRGKQEEDPIEAARWFRRAAIHGDYAGQAKLGEVYLEGRGVPPDPAESYRWYSTSLINPALPPNWRPVILEALRRLKPLLKPAQIGKARALAGSFQKVDPRARPKAENPAPAAAGPATPSFEASPAAAPLEAPGVRPAVTRPKDYAVVIGSAGCPKCGARARFAEADALAMRGAFLALGMPAENVAMIRGKDAVVDWMRTYQQDWLAQHVTTGSTVYVYFAGLGATDPYTGMPYLLGVDADPRFLAGTALSCAELQTTLAALPAKSVVVLLDASFFAVGGRAGLGRGAQPRVARMPKAPRGSRVTVLAAAMPDETTGELTDEGHGAFTHALLAAFAAGKTSPAELRDFSAPPLAARAKKEGRTQTPLLVAP